MCVFCEVKGVTGAGAGVGAVEGLEGVVTGEWKGDGCFFGAQGQQFEGQKVCGEKVVGFQL